MIFLGIMLINYHSNNIHLISYKVGMQNIKLHMSRHRINSNGHHSRLAREGKVRPMNLMNRHVNYQLQERVQMNLSLELLLNQKQVMRVFMFQELFSGVIVFKRLIRVI